jgi:IS5 family transposase
MSTRRSHDWDRITGTHRVAVEHALAHVGRWQGDRARYLGLRKNLFDLRRVAVVHNLHVIARHPQQTSQAA